MTKATVHTRPSLSPLLKWSGGKRSEIKFLSSSFPKNINELRVVEPFSGGAAVAFHLNSAGGTVLNDLNPGLVRFYRALGDPAVRPQVLAALRTLDGIRKEMASAVDRLDAKTIASLYASFQPWLDQQIAGTWLSPSVPSPDPNLDLPSPAVLPPPLAAQIKKDLAHQLKSKLLVRIPALETKRGRKFSTDERRDHLETGLQSGLYTAMRRVYNQETAVMGNPARPELSLAWQVAAWWFVRALCYSGMFRYGKGGAFNVPYGGIGYNARDFLPSLRDLNSPVLADFLARTEVNAQDFDALFDTYNGFGQDDFIFLDPPYDSEFSQYNAEGDFTREDQKRLAARLKKTAAPWMLVIKNTPFILSLYQDEPGITLYRGVFSKNYQVNFRNRHDRGVEHLVVANYPLTYLPDDAAAPGIHIL